MRMFQHYNERKQQQQKKEEEKEIQWMRKDVNMTVKTEKMNMRSRTKESWKKYMENRASFKCKKVVGILIMMFMCEKA